MVDSNDLVNCLEATLSPDTTIRQRAESLLLQTSNQQGFSLSLVTILQAAKLPVGIRHLAGVLLRRHIQRCWAPEDRDPSIPFLTDDEKAQIRSLLPASLADPNSRIQTAVGVAIAEIGKSDCPVYWPDLLPGLVSAINNDQNNPHLVMGAVRCLALLTEDLSENQVVVIAPSVLPELLKIVSSSSDGSITTSATMNALKRQALGIFHDILVASEVAVREIPTTVGFLNDVLGPWLQALHGVLSQTTTIDNPEFWGVQFDALGCLNRVVASFSKAATDSLPPLLSLCWQTFNALLPIYEQLVLFSDDTSVSDGVQVDSALATVSFSDLVSQLFEVLMTVLGTPRLLPSVKPFLQELVYLSIGYMQMPNDKVEEWEGDVNAYLADQVEEIWAPRASGEMMLDEILEVAGRKDGLAALAGGVERRLQECSSLKSNGNDIQRWWRLKEASLHAIGVAAEHMDTGKGFGSSNTSAVPTSLEPENVVTSIFQEDLNPSSSSSISPLLASRAMWVIYKFGASLSPPTKSAALSTLCPVIAPNHPALIQISACRAVSSLCTQLSPDAVHQIADTAWQGLITLLPDGGCGEDALGIVVDALTSLVRADPAGALKYEASLCPNALNVWVNNINDPVLSEYLKDLLRAVMNASSGCLNALQTRAVPTLCGIISNPAHQSPILIAESLELLTMMLQAENCSKEATAATTAAAMPAAIQLMRTSDDDAIVAGASEFVRTCLQRGAAEALVWGAGPNGEQTDETAQATSMAIVQAVLGLLQTGRSDNACCYCADIILEILRHAPSLIGPLIPSVLAASAQYLPGAEAPKTVQSLLSMLSVIVLADANSFCDILAQTVVLAAPSTTTGLQVVLSKWAERQMEIRTAYSIRLTLSALAALLTCPHPALDSVVVKGKRIDTGSGIRTRSKAATVKEEWSQVSFRVKTVMLLVDGFIESDVQGSGALLEGEDEEEWLDSEDDSGDGTEDGSENGQGGFFDEYGMFRGLNGSDLDGLDALEMELGHVDTLEAERRKHDPLTGMDVGKFVGGVFRSLNASNPGLVQTVAGELTPTQMEAAQRLM